MWGSQALGSPRPCRPPGLLARAPCPCVRAAPPQKALTEKKDFCQIDRKTEVNQLEQLRGKRGDPCGWVLQDIRAEASCSHRNTVPCVRNALCKSDENPLCAPVQPPASPPAALHDAALPTLVSASCSPCNQRKKRFYVISENIQPLLDLAIGGHPVGTHFDGKEVGHSLYKTLQGNVSCKACMFKHQCLRLSEPQSLVTLSSEPQSRVPPVLFYPLNPALANPWSSPVREVPGLLVVTFNPQYQHCLQKVQRLWWKWACKSKGENADCLTVFVKEESAQSKFQKMQGAGWRRQQMLSSSVYQLQKHQKTRDGFELGAGIKPSQYTRHGLHAPAPGQGWEVGIQERAHTAQLPNTKRGFASELFPGLFKEFAERRESACFTSSVDWGLQPCHHGDKNRRKTAVEDHLSGISTLLQLQPKPRALSPTHELPGEIGDEPVTDKTGAAHHERELRVVTTGLQESFSPVDSAVAPSCQVTYKQEDSLCCEVKKPVSKPEDFSAFSTALALTELVEHPQTGEQCGLGNCLSNRSPILQEDTA
ncbi:hypothetical protein Anapl_11636 [Anas platyrhynchos]|uniref:Uncharacterized protein n=1 Tax=Anas platyrhynchos TaxID=8839 RepID=R0L947_ANAPL|nr:hypothetical protein Anapl_11636 [Anas platyrhynchos]